MSLAYLNLIQHEGKNHSEEYLERMAKAWGPIRARSCNGRSPDVPSAEQWRSLADQRSSGQRR
jgi:hypothetical protein